MSHVLAYDGQYFRVDITEVANRDDPDKAVYISWCSDAFKELKDMPSQSISRFIAGPPLPKYDDARRHAYDWIKTSWDAHPFSVVFTDWLSTIPAVGSGCLPSATRTARRRTSLIRSQTPVLTH
jgi:hypothetical protein